MKNSLPDRPTDPGNPCRLCYASPRGVSPPRAASLSLSSSSAPPIASARTGIACWHRRACSTRRQRCHSRRRSGRTFRPATSWCVPAPARSRAPATCRPAATERSRSATSQQQSLVTQQYAGIHDSSHGLEWYSFATVTPTIDSAAIVAIVNIAKACTAFMRRKRDTTPLRWGLDAASRTRDIPLKVVSKSDMAFLTWPLWSRPFCRCKDRAKGGPDRCTPSVGALRPKQRYAVTCVDLRRKNAARSARLRTVSNC